jgi:hypothetical protein
VLKSMSDIHNRLKRAPPGTMCFHFNAIPLGFCPINRTGLRRHLDVALAEVPRTYRSAQANWIEAFHPLPPDRTEFERDMGRPTSLRNEVAQSRPLSETDRLELRQLAARVLPS